MVRDYLDKRCDQKVLKFRFTGMRFSVIWRGGSEEISIQRKQDLDER